MTIYDNIWQYMMLYGYVWQYMMMIYDDIWCHMMTHANIWLYMMIYANIWSLSYLSRIRDFIGSAKLNSLGGWLCCANPRLTLPKFHSGNPTTGIVGAFNDMPL